MALPSQKRILTPLQGVWEGSYTTFAPDGTLLERFDSRQELRLDGDRWLERIVYLREGREPEVHDFRARFDHQGKLRFSDHSLEGALHTVSEDTLLFVYHWRSRPRVRIRELVTLHLPDTKLRLWQRTEGAELLSVTTIRETRRPDLEPADW